MNKEIEKKKKTRKSWTKEEIEIFNSYIKENQSILIKLIYQNIFKGEIIFKKENGFFKNLSKLLERSSIQCKSKFQKSERDIYTNVLEVPQSHYELYSNLPKRGTNNKRKIYQQKSKFTDSQLNTLKTNIKSSIDIFGINFDLLKGTLFNISG